MNIKKQTALVPQTSVP